MSDERTLARPCELCGEAVFKMGISEPNALWESPCGAVRVVHARCKRRHVARQHGLRPLNDRPTKRGPRAA